MARLPRNPRPEDVAESEGHREKVLRHLADLLLLLETERRWGLIEINVADGRVTQVTTSDRVRFD